MLNFVLLCQRMHAYLQIADSYNARVLVVEAHDGTWVRELTGSKGMLLEPSGVAVVRYPLRQYQIIFYDLHVSIYLFTFVKVVIDSLFTLISFLCELYFLLFLCRFLLSGIHFGIITSFHVLVSGIPILRIQWPISYLRPFKCVPNIGNRAN